MKRAFLVSIKNWNMVLAEAAETPGKAKSHAWYAAHGAGYDIPFVDFRAKRAPRFDGLAQEQAEKMPWTMGWADGGSRWGCLEVER